MSGRNSLYSGYTPDYVTAQRYIKRENITHLPQDTIVKKQQTGTCECAAEKLSVA